MSSPNQVRCNFCHREFKNRQATRAHLRFCDAYQHRDALGTPMPQARMPRETVPKGNNSSRQNANQRQTYKNKVASSVQTSDQRRNTSRLSRDRQQHMEVLITVREDIQNCLTEAIDYLWFAKIVGPCQGIEEGLGLEDDWRELCLILLHCQRVIGEMVEDFLLDRQRLADVYNWLSTVKARWIKYRGTRLDLHVRQLNVPEGTLADHWQQNYDSSGLAEEEQMVFDIIQKVRRLWVASA